MSPAPPPAAQAQADGVWPVLQAPPDWRVLDFISDLHLQASEPASFDAWRRYMQHTRADAVFILGDLFDVWVGDDAAGSGFELQCVEVLQQAGRRLKLFFMHGNRDFLVGAKFMALCNTTLLADPATLHFGGQQWLLSHGDALCLADTDYQAFRATVRNPLWQQDFLAKPLDERKAVARALRAQSEARKRSHMGAADLDLGATKAWLARAQARQMIHGHTHRPADHSLGDGMQRIVLSDWDAGANPPRTQVLRLSIDVVLQAGGTSAQADSTDAGVCVQRISPAEA